MINNEVREYLITSIVNAAIRSGAEIMNIYSHPDTFSTPLKSDAAPIVEANRRAHNTIKESLGATRIPILSEEGREMRFEERRNWELFWLVDPLDGTLEFINHTDEFTVNIALMSEDKAVAGVIYVPYLKRLFFASKGKGAFVCENVEGDAEASFSYEQIVERFEQLPLRRAARPTQVVAISRSHNTPETFAHIEALKERNPQFEVVEQGSSYKFCLLAEGSVDYYVRTSSTFEWDTAAGEIILAEAGGTTHSLKNRKPLEYNKEELENPWFICKAANCEIK